MLLLLRLLPLVLCYYYFVRLLAIVMATMHMMGSRACLETPEVLLTLWARKARTPSGDAAKEAVEVHERVVQDVLLVIIGCKFEQSSVCIL